MSFLFGQKDKRTTYEKARDQSKEISSSVRREKRVIDREINNADREIQRLTNDIRKHAKTNNTDALKTLAKAIVKLKHNKSNLYNAKGNLDSIEMAVKTQLTNVRLTGVMQTSSEIAQSLSELMKVEQLQAVSREFTEELIRMGIVGEMIDEAVTGALDNPDLEEEADEEAQRVIDEVLGQKIGQLPSAIASPAEPEAVEEDEFTARIQALKA